ncbi:MULTISPECIES: hypothetical protein [unclassified Curtobacterium]|uniref:hypothetical protein n=1 Tax=unclassified Curtobacterium TaxID=257496 RepID=UPI00226B95DA|nr:MULTISPECIES: hypothetical protein [unclassified Curtobacterium]
MRPSTVLLTCLTAVFGIATIVLAVRVSTAGVEEVLQVLRLGGIVTVGFGAALLITVVNRRRRDRLRTASEAHPGTLFVNAHSTGSTAAELAAWSPGLRVAFPCDLGFDTNGLTSWPTRAGEEGTLIATRREISGFDVFDEPTPLGSTSRWGIAVRLTSSTAGSGRVHLWLLDGEPYADEFAMRATIARIESALGP